MAEIKHLLHIKASPSEIYKAITEERGLKNWREPTDFFASCNYHWGYYLRSLKLLLETGEGTPFKELTES
jgi:hypothetical protein